MANTIFRKRWGKRWTHTQQHHKRQIDYILLEKKDQSLIKDAEACNLLDLNSDHRAVRVILDLTHFRLNPPPSAKGWAASDSQAYQQQLDAKLSDLR